MSIVLRLLRKNRKDVVAFMGPFTASLAADISRQGGTLTFGGVIASIAAGFGGTGALMANTIAKQKGELSK